ncbi:hypothetical protein D3C81_1977800 [compost metagenome]
MGMGADAQAGMALEHCRTRMIEKTPRADHPPLARGHQAIDGDPPTDLRRACANALDRPATGLHRAIR